MVMAAVAAMVGELPLWLTVPLTAALGVAVAVRVYMLWMHVATKGIPSPGFLWIAVNFGNFYRAISELHQRVSGGLHHIYLGPQSMIAVTDPELVKQVRARHHSDTLRLLQSVQRPLPRARQVVSETRVYAKNPMSKITKSALLSEFLKDTIVTLNHDEWWRVKSTFSAAFHMTGIKGLVPVLHARSERLCQLFRARARLSGSADGSVEVDFVEWSMRLSLDVLCHALFSYDIGAMPDDEAAAMKRLVAGRARAEGTATKKCPACGHGSIEASPIEDAFACIVAALGDFKVTAVPNYDKMPFAHRDCLPGSIATMNALLRTMIAENKQAVQRRHGDMGAATEQGADDHEGKTGNNILYMMWESVIDTGANVTEEEMRANLAALLIAGHDTTATSIAWIAHYLATHQAVQDKLREELIDKLGPLEATDAARARSPAPEDVSQANLPYLFAVMMEAVRLRPPFTRLPTRVATCDASLGGRTIKKGMLVVPDLYALHHDPAQWDNPEQFRPERHLPGTKAKDVKRSRHRFMPFGSGARQCIGRNFANVERAVLLSHLLRSWKLEVPACGATHDGLEPHFFVTRAYHINIRLVPL